MNEKALPIGIDDFEQVVTRNYYFIDKTLFIKELLDKKGSVNLFTRPRRFGKTLNMSMLQYFFQDVRDVDGTKVDYTNLFNGLNIMETGEKYLAHMGQYPVISLSLKSAKQPDFEMAYCKLVEEIAGEFKRHRYVLNTDALLPHEKKRYKNIMAMEGKKSDYNTALKFLSECLMAYHHKKVIILIDEYDVPLESAFFKGFYEEMVDFLRSLFESALKTNSNLEFAVVTGCLRISKESIFIGLNNIEIISMLNKQYDEYFGFTNAEVQKICEDYHLSHKYDLIKEWYNGYIMGETNVYNPWSVVRFIKDLCEDENKLPCSYWANTSSNNIVKKLIERADEETKAEIETLIEGMNIEKPVHEDFTYDEVYQSIDNLWNFMFFTGYFKKISERMDKSTNQIFFRLAIPNKEVNYIFRTKVLSWFREKTEERDLSVLYNALVNKDVSVLEEELNEILMETISFNDAYENFYHGFVTGVLSGMKNYRVKSNREGGSGRSDLFIQPITRRKAAFVIEFKVADKFEQLEQKAEEALQQIADRHYVEELRNDGYQNVIQYGISFFRKDCLVKIKEY